MSNRDITLAYQNVRGLNTKTHEFYKAVSSCDYDVVAITETWIQDGVCDSELFGDSYIVYRKDRDLNALNVSKGGGVLIGVKQNLISNKIDLSNLVTQLPAVDVVGCRMVINGKTIYLFVIYIQPNSPTDYFEVLFDFFSSFPLIQNEKVIFLGDFNIHFHVNPDIRNPKLVLLRDFLSFFDLQQFNKVQNDKNYVLDLILSNIECAVNVTDLPFVREDTPHPALVIVFNSLAIRDTVVNFPKNSNNRNYNFYKANYPLLYQLISDADWSILDRVTNVDGAVTEFYNILYNILDQAVPRYHSDRPKSSYPSWYTREIISDLKEKSRVRGRWKKSGFVQDLDLFKRLRRTIKIKIDIAYRNFVDSSENNIKSDPMKFWKFVRQRRRTSRIPGSMILGNNSFESPHSIVNAFADFFKSVYVNSSCPSPDDSNNCFSNANISLYQIRHSDITKALKKLKNKHTAGPDLIPSFLLRDCATCLTKPLHAILNLSLKTNSFPHKWKFAKICPVFKGGDINDIANYRPISILSNFSKVFEMCIYEKLFSQVRNIISPRQHGFYHKRSTITNLTCFLQKAYETINKKIQLDVIYTDFSKAFDKLDHGLVAKKMIIMGFHENLINFFMSYLSNRIQYVEYNGFRSYEYCACSGAPQGSNLAPLLFSIFINDLAENISSGCLLFADDLKLFRTIQNHDDCLSLQNDIRIVSEWCDINALPLNVKKCRKMTISTLKNEINFNYILNGAVLPDCESVRDLGITVDKKLTFNAHIDNVVQSALKTLGFVIRSTSQFRTTHSLITLFNALVKSKLLYGSMVWHPYYKVHIIRLERVQRRFLKYLSFKINGAYPARGFDHGTLLAGFDFKSLEHCTILSSQCFLFKLCNNLIDSPELLSQVNFLVPPANTRQHNRFYLPFCRTNLSHKAPLCRACSWHNQINNVTSIDIFDSSLNSFKKRVVCSINLF